MTVSIPAAWRGARFRVPRRVGGERLGGVAGRIAVLCAGVGVLVATAWFSLFVGAGDASPAQVVAALGGHDGSNAATIVRDMRLPRGLTAMLVGLALGVAGTIMQALIGNPLADPGLLGVNAGAGLAVVVAVGFLGLVGFNAYIWFALCGALVVSLFVYAISATAGRGSPFTVVLSGVAVSAVLMGVTNALALIDPTRFNALRTWMAGSVTGRDGGSMLAGSFIILAGLVVAVIIAAPLAQLGLGEDTARSLGVRVGPTRFGATIAVMLLAGTATALGGPIMFVGLMVPHLAHALVGPRLVWAIVYSAVGGALLVLLADMVGRVVAPPGEAPAGLITAILGAPVLALLAQGRHGAAS